MSLRIYAYSDLHLSTFRNFVLAYLNYVSISLIKAVLKVLKYLLFAVSLHEMEHSR